MITYKEFYVYIIYIHESLRQVEMMEKILIIEDDKDINEMLQKLLKVNGYEVMSAYSGTEGVILHNKDISLIILDLMLPGKNGEEIIGELQAKSEVPIIVTTAIHDMDKKLDLFELGADDYVTKPFNNNELLARIKVHLRKKNNAGQSRNLTFKDIELNLDDYTIKCNGKDIVLPKIEFEILRTLMERPNHVHTKNNLIESVWDNEDSADDNTLNVHISKIRNRLNKANPDEEYIETVWKIGYKMKN
jgi:DNA-binding response OmpR family regulator